LYQQVREHKKLVHSVDAWTYSPGNPGLFGLSAVADGDKFVAARCALLDEVEKLRRSPVSAAELGKAVKQFTAATLVARKTMQGQAQDLGGSWLAANDLGFSERYLAAVRKVRTADLLRVARKYLTAENRTLYALLPAGFAPRQSSHVAVTEEHPIQKIEFPNGLRLLIKEDHRLPFVELRAVLRGGVLAESLSNNGSTQLVSRLLLKGTRTRTAEQIATQIESVGGSIDSFGGNNSFGVSMEVMSGDLSRGLEVFADVLLNSTFPAEAVAREREVQLAGIRAQKDQLLQSAFRAMRRALFGDTGYGLDTLGSEESVASLERAALRSFHQSLSIPNNCVLAIYGDVRVDKARAAVRAAFGKWKAGSAIATPGRQRASPGGATNRVTETREKKQAVIVVGFPGIQLTDPDRHALELIQEACSDLGSRLFMRIRDQLGLAYYVGAQNFVGLAPGFFAFYCGTAPEQAALVEKELFAEAGLLRDEGLSKEELARAKAKVVGQRKIARQDLGHLATATALDELYGLGYANIDAEDARYEAVTLDQIRAVARKFLDSSKAVVTVVKPGELAPV
jgi:zinc protease